MLKRLSIIFVFLTLLSSFAEAFHHHGDGDDHPDCSICAASHHKSDTDYSFAVPHSAPQASETPYTRTALDDNTTNVFALANTRAPPA